MNKLKLLIIFVISYMFLAGCSHMQDKRYLVSFYQMDNPTKSDITDYFVETKHLLSKQGASYLDAPLLIDKELPNSAQPEYTQHSPGNVIFIAEFPNREKLDDYLKSVKVIEAMDGLGNISQNENVFIAEDFNPMGMMNDASRLGSFEYRKDSGFLMLNSIAMNSFINPMTPYRIMSYMNNNFPRLEAAQVRMIMPFEKVEDVRGFYDYEVLFLSEWPSEEVFNKFHSDKGFIELAQDTRNKAFSGFTESSAHVATEIK